MSGTGTGYLKIPNGPLRIYCSESRPDEYVPLSLEGKCLTENFLHLLVSQDLGRTHVFVDLPTLELASVRLM